MPSRRTMLASLGAAGAAAVGGPAGAASGRARAAQSRAPEAVWTRQYGESPAFAIVDDVVPVDDGYVLAGTTREPSRGLVAGTDRAGRPRWHRTLGDARSTLSAVAPHPDGGVVAAGTRNVGERQPWSDDPPSADPWLVRLDADGELDWARTLQPSAVAGGVTSLCRAGDGFLLGGDRQAGPGDADGPWVAHVSAAGHRQWARTLQTPRQRGAVTAVAAGADGWYAGGSTTAGEEASDDETAVVVGLDPDGAARWQYAADGPKGSRIEALHADGDGVVAVGNRRFARDDDGLGWHLRVGPGGTVGWERSHSTGPWNWLHALAAVDGGYLLVGTREVETDGTETDGTTADGSDGNLPRGAWVLRTGPAGRPEWETTYRDGGTRYGRAVHAFDGGGFLVAGETDAASGAGGWLLNAGGPAPVQSPGWPSEFRPTPTPPSSARSPGRARWRPGTDCSATTDPAVRADPPRRPGPRRFQAANKNRVPETVMWVAAVTVPMHADLPEIGLGTYEADPDDCAASVETALEAGYRHVDTAEMYENEAAVGEGLAAADVDREAVVVATKVHSSNLAYDDAVAAARASRDRLGVDAIDLLYVHWPIRSYDPEETLAAFDDLRDDGVIRHVGLSNFTPELLDEALAHLDAPLLAHQVECHPLLPQRELRGYAREHDHHLVAYSPLAKGAVLDDPVLVEIADDLGATPAQVSLAWLLAKDAVAIPKASSPAHIRENYAARQLALPDAAVERIDAIDRRERVVDFEAAPWN